MRDPLTHKSKSSRLWSTRRTALLRMPAKTFMAVRKIKLTEIDRSIQSNGSEYNDGQKLI